MRTIRGRRAVVTGAASGIGRCIALALAREGADLYLVDIDAMKLRDTAREAERHNVDVKITICDLAQPAAVGAAVRDMLATCDRIDILVNNAGVCFYGSAHEMTAEQWDWLMAINLMAPIQFVRELLPALTRQDEAHIVNVASMFGLFTTRKLAAYHASKFGLVGFTQALRNDYSRPHIGITALCPGFVQTPLLDNAPVGQPHAQRKAVSAWISTNPEHVAEVAIRAIRRNKGIVLITPLAHVLWRMWRWFPRLSDWLNREGWRRKGKLEIAPR
jgi:3-oxoacyl-[acyl-carrier protein] reductase